MAARGVRGEHVVIGGVHIELVTAPVINPDEVLRVLQELASKVNGVSREVAESTEKPADSTRSLRPRCSYCESGTTKCGRRIPPALQVVTCGCGKQFCARHLDKASHQCTHRASQNHTSTKKQGPQESYDRGGSAY